MAFKAIVKKCTPNRMEVIKKAEGIFGTDTEAYSFILTIADWEEIWVEVRDVFPDLQTMRAANEAKSHFCWVGSYKFTVEQI